MWLTCEVLRTGPAENGKIYIALSDVNGSFGFRWFEAIDIWAKEMLATALTALTTGFHVTALLDEGAPEYSVISRLYVLRR